MKSIKELAIGGGGVKGLSFLGALYYLEKRNLLNELEKVSGSSIGSFLATCLVIGLKPSEMIDYLFEYDFKKIKDVDLGSMINRRSLMKGDNLQKFYKDVISLKEDPYITLEELYRKTKIELIVSVTCVNSRKVEYINYKSDPQLDILSLMYMSSSIPGFFPHYPYRNKLYIDGGIIDNLPLSVLSENAWGITSTSNENEFISTEKMSNYFVYVSNILKLIYDNIQKEYDHKNIIKIYVGNIEVTSFNVTKDDKLTLIQSGINAAKENFQI